VSSILKKLFEEVDDIQLVTEMTANIGDIRTVTKIKSNKDKDKDKDKDDDKGDSQNGDGQPGDGQPGDGQPGDGQPGDGQPGDGQPGDGQPGDGQPGDGQPGDGQPGDGQPGDGQPGDGQPGEGQPGGGKTTTDIGDDDPNGPKIMDDHEGMDKGKGVGSFKKIFDKVYKTAKEVEKQAGKSGGYGDNSGSLMRQVEGFLEPHFDVDGIMKKLNKFKRLSAEEYSTVRAETFQASAFNPVNQHSPGSKSRMNQPGMAKIGKDVKPFKRSAILFFSIDTSGSIGPQDFAVIKGYLREIVNRFAKTIPVKNNKGRVVGHMGGEVYLLEWDTELKTPIRKWTKVGKNGTVAAITNPNLKKGKYDAAGGRDAYKEEFKVRGGGGTNINRFFSDIDVAFHRVENGKEYFDLDDSADYIATDADKFESQEDLKTEFKKDHLKAELKNNNKKWKNPKKQKELDLNDGILNFTENHVSGDPTPFLIVYTDGCFSPAKYQNSELFKNNPGNILYILTMPDMVDNISPKNVVFHDLQKEHARPR